MFERRFDLSGHDNNLNLIRAGAATCVLISHAWPLTFGPGTPEPMQGWLGISLGTVSVYVFFAISGLLIAASFARTGSVGRFMAARAMRLFPGLIVSLVLVAFVMAPLVTTLPVSEYLGHERLWRFMVANSLLIVPQYDLPGVFETNPYPSVEGSIWSLPFEVGWYGVVLIAGLAGMLERRWAMLALVLAGIAGWLLAERLDLDTPARFFKLGIPFSMGMAFWAWRTAIPASGWVLAALVLPGMLVVLSPLGFPLFMLLLVYATFWLAYVPGGWLRGYNGVGDYSYGIYIYAFPVQGLVMWLFQPANVALHIALAFPGTLLLAMASWHLVEGPAMKLLRRKRAPEAVPAAGSAVPVVKP